VKFTTTKITLKFTDETLTMEGIGQKFDHGDVLTDDELKAYTKANRKLEETLVALNRPEYRLVLVDVRHRLTVLNRWLEARKEA